MQFSSGSLMHISTEYHMQYAVHTIIVMSVNDHCHDRLHHLPRITLEGVVLMLFAQDCHSNADLQTLSRGRSWQTLNNVRTCFCSPAPYAINRYISCHT
jgi:hypothetical protein